MTGHKEEIGNALRDARQKAGLTLKDIADAIRIRPIYLQAIEAGQFELLPALPQTVGFTRAYAKYLDVDVEQPLSRLGEEVHETIERADYSEPEIPWTMISTGRLAWVGGGVLFGLLLAASFVIDFGPPREEIAVASVEAEKAAAIAARAASAPAVSAEVRSVAAVADRGNTILPAAPETQASGPVVADLVSRAPAREAPAMLQQASFTSGNEPLAEMSASEAAPASAEKMEAVPDVSSLSGVSSAGPEAVPVVSTEAAPEPAVPASTLSEVPGEEQGDNISSSADPHFATGSVYVRSRPDNSGKIVGVLNSCEEVALLGRDRTEYWREVKRQDGTSGWVFRDYVSGEAPAACS
ncbi:MAG: hypothetical protein CMI62_06430 [Parvibaculum sp.]|jgi:cytoskeleton protein RodZ|uniref:helix-turn-helix domain-containing protein n=1 Tax=Parvibaculum sp. TaxID=2024848 RepID=UPI000C4A2A39|nr:helix-turn-helix domain-containing protein [Parvibaculum sp.]MAU60352.1 hypothetical protein [Parvibaculum sp.]|tara:strand:+ start:1160 stop:2221 length:1062 start_codon:yes stop_codon:yes gene_type:complete